ncbi:MAG TPA: HD-GYP domain-containing protein [Candidatus Acidoferrum sp.]|nr:HD-GYP domain-containing protein [Candidatus Acidoferrum sp.]
MVPELVKQLNSASPLTMPSGEVLLASPEGFRIKVLEEQVAALRNSVICAFNQLLDLKDLNTGVHSTRLAEWGLRVGQELGLDDATLRNLEVAALLHDIGKVGIPDAILRKPGKLDPDEYALIKKHPDYGWAVLRMLPGFESAALDILHHHESVDGTGYPAGLRNSEIPIVSRIVCVIDAYDAMVSSRPYRKGLPFEEAARRLTACSGTQFDADVVRSFLPIAQAEMETVFAAAGTAVDSAL